MVLVVVLMDWTVVEVGEMVHSARKRQVKLLSPLPLLFLATAIHHLPIYLQRIFLCSFLWTQTFWIKCSNLMYNSHVKVLAPP